MNNTQKPSAAVRFFSVLSLILCIVMGLEVGTGMILAFSGEVPASDAVPMVLVFAVLTVVFGLIHRKLRQRVKLWKEQQKADAKAAEQKKQAETQAQLDTEVENILSSFGERMCHRFTNQEQEYIVVADEGIYFADKKQKIIFPRSEVTKPLEFNTFSERVIIANGETNYFFSFPGGKTCAPLIACIKRFNDMRTKPLSADIVFNEATFGVRLQPFEYRMRCNVCGHVYTYTEKDVEDNIRRAKHARTQALIGLGTTLASSTVIGNAQSNRARDEMDKVIDFKRCPKCQSYDITQLKEGEPSVKKEKQDAPAASAMDELKKLKELLELGAVTQEEFDAKKKQLLGL